MSHNLVQKRGRYPKAKQESNRVQGGWQAQTLSVPSQSQGFSDVDYNYQNQNQKDGAQNASSYSNQWPVQQNVVNDDWGDWGNWENNNTQQSQPTQSYYGQLQHQQAQNQQTPQYPVHDHGYHQQHQSHHQQQQQAVNQQAYDRYTPHVDLNNTSYPPSCSTPHYQYDEANTGHGYSLSSQFEPPVPENQGEVQQTYPSQSTTPVSIRPLEQMKSLDNSHAIQQPQYNHDNSFQSSSQQDQLHQQLPQSPLQNYNNFNYDPISQHNQVPHQQQFTDYSNAYSNVEYDGNESEKYQYNCMSDCPAAMNSTDQKIMQSEYNLEQVSFDTRSSAQGDGGFEERTNGPLEATNGSPILDENVQGSPPISHEHRDEPISDSWDTLEDNFDCLSIKDPAREASAEKNRDRRSLELGAPPLESQQVQDRGSHQAQHLHESPGPEQHLNEDQFRQPIHPGEQPQLGQNVPLGQHNQNAEDERPLQTPHREAEDEARHQAVTALPSLSEVLQAKNLNSETGQGDIRSMDTAGSEPPLQQQAFQFQQHVLHPQPQVADAPSLVESAPKSRTTSIGSAHSGRRDSFDTNNQAFDMSSQERTSYMADMVRPASEGAPAEEKPSVAPTAFPLPPQSPISNLSNVVLGAEDSQNEWNDEPLATREVVGQRASAERSAPAGVDQKASSVRQSPLGGEGGNLAPPAALSKAPAEAPIHVSNSESYRSGSQDERARSRRSQRSSSSEDGEVAEHNREMLHQKMKEREHELPAVSKRDQRWKDSRDRLREHNYHSDESEVRKHRRRGNRESDGERARRKYASDRDYEEDDYYDQRRHRRRSDRRRDSDDTDYSEYVSERRHKYRIEDDSDVASGRQTRRSEEIRRPRNRKYPEESDFDSRRSGRKVNDRSRRDKRHDFYYGRPPSQGSSLNDTIATSQISDSEASMYVSRRRRPTTFDRHPAMGMQQIYDPRAFQSNAHGFQSINLNMHSRQAQIVRPPQQNQISMGMIPQELRGQDLEAVRNAYETDPDYRDTLDDYFEQCVAQGFDISKVRAYVCNEPYLPQPVSMCPADLNDSMTSSIAFAESSTRNEEPAPPEELRKFIMPHAFACFSSLNTLVKLHPTNRSLDMKPPVVEIHDLKLILEDDPESKALAKFPGPLVRADTHKNQVIHFCNQRVNAIRKNKPYVDHIVDRESYVLLWELLILLLRQNGHVTGTDIAELLLKDAPYVDPASVQKLAEQEMSQIEESDKASSDDSQTTVDGTRLNRRALQTRRQGLSNEQALSRFRELLLFGHRKEAIEHAIRYELWGHAFCLSSKMDIKMYTYVHSKFYHSFAGNDPLQTVYQLYSGRQPTSVTCVGDVTWGDWRPHLAMILANPSARPEIDARSIVTMGDILLSRGCLCAAHFCYLMAQVDFGEYQDKRCKLVLLGSNHMRNFDEFATNEAIVCTEIYEYAQSLSNPGYTLPTLGLYKYLHAKRLVDQGFVQEGLHYCERLAIDIVRNVDAYKPELVHEVFNLASRLRYNDAHYSHDAGNYDEIGHPQWLMNLEHVNIALQNGSPIDRTIESRRSSDFDGANVKLEPQYAEYSAAQQQIISAPQQQQPQQVYDYFSQLQQPPPPQQQHQKVQQSYYSQPNELSAHGELKEENLPQATDMPDFSNEPYSRTSSVNEMHQTPAAHQAIPEHLSSNHAPIHYGQRQSVTSISSSITSATTNDSILRPAPPQNDMTYYQQKPITPAAPKTEMVPPQTPPATAKKSAPTSRAGHSWLNGIFKRILPKGPNQMILPDDKDQSIIWDEEKKVWVDRNADSAAQETSLAPPPSDLSLGAAPSPPPAPFMSPSQPAPQDVPQAVPSPLQAVDRVQPAATPPSGANRFQRITSKPRYVDVFKQNNQTAPAMQTMAPILPDGQAVMPSAQPQFFVPTLPTGGQDEPFDLMSNRLDYDEQQQSQESDKQSGR